MLKCGRMTPALYPVALFCEYFPTIDSEFVGDCVHAEGGKYAIYEQCDNIEVNVYAISATFHNTFAGHHSY